jgi:anthranilate synthase component 1
MKDKKTDSYIIHRIPGDKYTPYGLACKLEARVILESSSLSRGRARYSLLLAGEAFRVVQEKGNEISIQIDRNWKKLDRPKGEDILNVIEDIASQHEEIGYQDFPVPAGGIGFLSFEFSQYCDSMVFPERTDPLALPEAAFIFGHIFCIFDHYTDEIIILGLNYREHMINLEQAVKEMEEKIFDFNFNYMMESKKDRDSQIINIENSEDEYKGFVKEIKKEIVKGNLLQCVPSRRLAVKSSMTAMEAYRNLRSANPSPYMFYLDFENFELFGSSPEVHVKINQGKAVLRPIAGTRRRGQTPGEDMHLEEELLGDEKERAEHIMLVDLGRNDLGRVSNPGTVKVTESMVIERYSKVMHIVSQVEGDLRQGVKPSDVIRATFPAGTVSGAPKIQAVNTIASLEKMPRTFYAGLVGYLEPNGQLDTCITIRSGVKKDGYFYLQAGGGIVFDSEPERELEETREKLRATALSLGLEV